MRLQDGEQVVVRMRRHPRALRGAAVTLVTTALLLGLAMGLLSRPGLPTYVRTARTTLEWLVWGIAVLSVLLWTVRPILRWLTGVTVLTSERLVLRPGLSGGPEAGMPLVAIADVQRRRRGSGAGDVHVLFRDPARQVYWRLRDVPEAERFEHVLAETTRGARERAWQTASGWGGVR